MSRLELIKKLKVYHDTGYHGTFHLKTNYGLHQCSVYMNEIRVPVFPDDVKYLAIIPNKINRIA